MLVELMRALGWTLLALVVAAGGCSSPGSFNDAGPIGGVDGSAPADAEPGFDDAAPPLDAEPSPDVDPTADAVPPVDVGPLPDADPAADAPPPLDSGPGNPDATVAGDAGINLDCARRAGINPNANMTFFVTSVGTGAAGGNLGGLAGADARCTCLAATVGAAAGRTWVAYLSRAAPEVNARDRIGAGPWFNFSGARVGDNASIHAVGGNIAGNLVLTEDGQTVPTAEHDILTGSDHDGTPHQNYDCGGWQDGTDTGYAWVGHTDWDQPNGSREWNTGHEAFCSPAGLAATAGSGRIYCFAR